MEWDGDAQEGVSLAGIVQKNPSTLSKGLSGLARVPRSPAHFVPTPWGTLGPPHASL